MSLDKCETEGCQGHLAKFADCISEALWCASLDWQPEQTGSTDFGIWACILTFDDDDEDNVVLLSDETSKVTVPLGFYMLTESSLGFVGHVKFETESEMRAEFGALQAQYLKWDSQDDETEV